MSVTITREEQIKKLNDAQDLWTKWTKSESERRLIRPAGVRSFAAANVITAKAEASLVFVAIKGHLTADLTFDNGQKMHFDAWPWGVGAGGGTGIGLYYGVDANTLAGGCHYHCQFGGIGGGFIQITCWRDGIGALGQINVAGLVEAAGELGGDDGSWTHS